MASSARLSLMGFLRPSLIHRFGKAPTARLLVRKYLVKPNKAFNGALSASKRLSKQDRFYEEVDHSHIMWWKDKMQLCKKPSTVQLIKRLDYSNLLGLDVNLRNGRLKEGTLNMELLQFKLRFPREVLLCRVGDFYEAIGFDACVLVEYAGLNPFGGLRSDSNPRAGCPVMVCIFILLIEKGNLRQTLDDLTRSGFSICIVEELQGPSQARSRKSRFVSGHAHPGSPYVFGLAGVDHDVEFPDPMPVIDVENLGAMAEGLAIDAGVRDHAANNEISSILLLPIPIPFLFHRIELTTSQFVAMLLGLRKRIAARRKKEMGEQMKAPSPSNPPRDAEQREDQVPHERRIAVLTFSFALIFFWCGEPEPLSSKEWFGSDIADSAVESSKNLKDEYLVEEDELELAPSGKEVALWSKDESTVEFDEVAESEKENSKPAEESTISVNNL
ncbi:hypothetical protein ZIOFF_024052 [Zingiber officinale]|uniref:DNA mismatch repair protein MutS-like N-terminal domain-containing protein n=1 Tax=Zingiber officinale TaxID=94328 RepID=A0A8J5GZT7_ZINOF|nr:hypothetical protein ZIOFF_024052 [Zingiber officinale]